MKNKIMGIVSLAGVFLFMFVCNASAISFPKGYIDFANNALTGFSYLQSAFGGNISKTATCVVSQDGTGDYNGMNETPIQNCLYSLRVTGGKIYVKQGTYNFTKNLIVNVSNVIIQGDGKDATILRQADSANLGNRTSGIRDLALIQVGIDVYDGRFDISNVEIKDLTIDFNADEQTVNYLSRGQEGLGGPTGIAIYIDGTDNFKIENCKIIDAYSVGVWIYGTDANSLENANVVYNEIKNVNTPMIGILSSGNEYRFLNVMYNYVILNSSNTYGIRLEEGDRSFAFRNHVNNNGGNGIGIMEISGSSPRNHYSSITNNWINATQTGIGAGLRSNHTIIRDNYVIRSSSISGKGIYVYGRLTKISGISIIGNHISHRATGIKIVNVTHSIIMDNLITVTTIGINESDGSDYNQIMENDLSGCTKAESISGDNTVFINNFGSDTFRNFKAILDNNDRIYFYDSLGNPQEVLRFDSSDNTIIYGLFNNDYIKLTDSQTILARGGIQYLTLDENPNAVSMNVPLNVSAGIQGEDYYSGNGNQGLTGTVTVRDAGGTSDCEIEVEDGLYISTTCTFT